MSFLDEIKEKVDIYEYISKDVNLSATGVGFCPFHEETSPSFKVYQDKGYWRCFGACSTKEGSRSWGSVIDYVARRDNLPFMEAAKKLAREFGIPISDGEKETPFKKEEIQKIRKEVLSYAHENLLKSNNALRYLKKQRGFSTQTIRDCFIGYLNNEAFAELTKRLGERELLEAGFLRRDPNTGEVRPRFYNHLVFPILFNGEAVFVVGRAMNPNAKIKYLNLEGSRVNYFYNHGALFSKENKARGEIFLVEGIPDCITMNQAGLPAVGLLGARNWKQELKKYFTDYKRVYILMDPDSAGEEGGERALMELEEKGCLISLPGDKDLNERYMAIFKDVYDISGGRITQQELEQINQRFKDSIWRIVKENGKDVVEYISQKVQSSGASTIAQSKALEQTLLSFSHLVDNFPLMETLKSHLVSSEDCFITKSVFNNILKNVKSRTQQKGKQEKKEEGQKEYEIKSVSLDKLGVEQEFYEFRPSLDFRGDKGYVLVFQKYPVEVAQNGRAYKQIVDIPLLVCSDRKYVPLSDPLEVYEKVGVSVNPETINSLVCLNGQSKSWPSQKLKAYLKGEIEANDKFTVSVYTAVRNLIEYYIEFSNPIYYHLVALWTIGTYLYPVFDAYPYLLLTGEKESGKTRTLMVLRLMAYNMILSTNITTAALFRTLEMGCTFGYDEAENLNVPNSEYITEINSILNAGYKKGLEIIRMEGDSVKVQRRFRVYGPKVISAIRSPSDVLASRCIPITMLRAGQNTEQARRILRPEDEKWGTVRHMQYVFALEKFKDVKEEYELLIEGDETLPIYGRALELWAPLLAILRTIYGSAQRSETQTLYEKLRETEMEILEMAKEIHGRYSVPDDKTCIFFLALKEHLEEEEAEYVEYTITEILSVINNYLELEVGEENQATMQDEKFTSKWVSQTLTKYGFTERRRLKTGESHRKGRYVYRITKEKIDDISTRYMIV